MQKECIRVLTEWESQGTLLVVRKKCCILPCFSAVALCIIIATFFSQGLTVACLGKSMLVVVCKICHRIILNSQGQSGEKSGYGQGK